jgi:hypothetical protein
MGKAFYDKYQNTAERLKKTAKSTKKEWTTKDPLKHTKRLQEGRM